MRIWATMSVLGLLADITARSRHVRFTPDCVAKLDGRAAHPSQHLAISL
jgi:hypothetical protein